MVIRWNRDLAAGSSLRSLDRAAIEQAYSPFLRRFDRMHRDRLAGRNKRMGSGSEAN